MRCPRCGTQIDDNTRFCDYCGARVREDAPEDLASPKPRLKKYLWIASVPLVLAAVAVGLLLWKPWAAKNMPTEPVAATTVEAEATPELALQTPVIPYEQRAASDLVLILEEDRFAVGETANVRVHVVCSQKVTGPVSVLDEEGRTVLQLENDGSGLLSGEFVVEETQSRLGSLKAVSGTYESEARFWVTPEITDEQLQTLATVCEELGEAVAEQGFADPASDEAKKFVQDWLEKDPRVAEYTENREFILFATNDGLVGAYMGGQGSEDGYSLSSAEDAFAAWEEGETEYIYGVDGQGTPTSSLLRFCVPDSSDPLIAENYHQFEYIFQTLADRTDLSYRFSGDSDARATLDGGLYADSALFVLLAHGELMDRKDGDPMLVYRAGSSFGELSGIAPHQFVGSCEDPEANRFIYTVKVSGDENGARSECFVLKTSTATMSELGDRLFNGTILYYIVCYAASDEVLVQFFLDRGAAGFIGGPDTVKDVTAKYVSMKLREVLGTSTELGSYHTLGQLGTMELSEEQNESLLAVLTEYAQEAIDGDPNAYEGRTASSLVEHYMTLFETNPVKIFCREPRQFLKGSGTLGCSVTTTDGDPVANASVVLYRWMDSGFEEVYSGVADGMGQLSLKEQPYGVYIIRASFNGVSDYRAWCFTPETVEAEPVSLPLFSLSGTVTAAASGGVLKGVTVTVSRNNDELYTDTTDEGGTYSFEMLPTGDYELVASLQNHSMEEINLQLAEDLVQNISMQMDVSFNAVHGNNIYQFRQSPAFGENKIYYVDGYSIRSVGYDGKGDRELLNLGAGLAPYYLNVVGDWLYFTCHVSENEQGFVAIKRLNLQGGQQEMLYRCAEENLYEDVIGMVVYDRYLFFGFERNKGAEEWVDVCCINLTNGESKILARFEGLQEASDSHNTVGFNCTGETVYIHVNGADEKQSRILSYTFAQLDAVSQTDIYPLEGGITHPNTFSNGTTYGAEADILLVQDGYIQLDASGFRVYHYHDLNTYDTLLWDLYQAGNSGDINKTLLNAPHYVVGDMLVIPTGSAIFVSDQGSDAGRSALKLRGNFNINEAVYGQNAEAVYFIYKHYESVSDDTPDKILLTVNPDGTYSEVLIDK